MIQIDGLTKTYGSRVAVDDLTVSVEPGRVTGFLGPNGSGKTTTMRCILGLTRPSAGRVTVLGRPYRELSRPMRYSSGASKTSSSRLAEPTRSRTRCPAGMVYPPYSTSSMTRRSTICVELS